MFTVKSIKKTCYACPSQWEGKTEDGKDIFIHLRNGYFYCNIDGKQIYESTPNGFDGVMDNNEMMRELRFVLYFPRYVLFEYEC